MNTTPLRWLGVVLCAGIAASVGNAQYMAPALHSPSLSAPDAFGSGFYAACPNGCAYAPNYCVRPPFPPVNGVPPPPWSAMAAQAQGCCSPTAAFPTHPYARGPRDYFMWTEAQRERITRERRPPLVP